MKSIAGKRKKKEIDSRQRIHRDFEGFWNNVHSEWSDTVWIVQIECTTAMQFANLNTDCIMQPVQASAVSIASTEELCLKSKGVLVTMLLTTCITLFISTKNYTYNRNNL